MIEDMLQKMGFVVLLLTAGFLVGCGTSTLGPGGSKEQTRTGVSGNGYPGAAASNDAQSPALSSSTETKYATPEVIAKDSSELPASAPETTATPASPAK